MTEDEAKTKWCCAAMNNDIKIRCLGSTCMAWRWDKNGWSMTFDEIGPCLRKDAFDLHGYCGLASKP